jgi:hypothetical protein
MTKNLTLVDFDIHASLSGLSLDEQRSINDALFATYEPIRLWIKEQSIKAPFRKLLVTFADESLAARWHGTVATAAEVCEVTEALSLSLLRQKAEDHRWVIDAVQHALGCIAQESGWRCEELEFLLQGLSGKSWPLRHFFANLAKVDHRSGAKFEPWLAVQPGLTQIGVLVSAPGEETHEAILASKPGLMYLEDEFPMARSKLDESQFLLLDKKGIVLSSVPHARSGLH